MTAPEGPPPAEPAYDALVDAVLPLYEAGRYDDALARLATAGDGLEPWSADLAHLRACLLSRAGRPEDALATLTAALDDGDWWERRILVDDDDLAALRSLDGFDALVREADARAHAYNSSTRADPPVVLRPGGAARGVAVVLHGSGQRAAAAAQTWSAATGAGFVVVAVASSQRSTPNHTSWPRQDLAARDVAHALGFLDDATRALPVLAGGFSAGGRAALLWGLTGDPVPVVRLLVVAPSVAPEQLPDELTPVPGSIVLGADDAFSGQVHRMTDQLARAGLKVETVEGLGHRYPDDFADRLSAELALVPSGSG